MRQNNVRLNGKYLWMAALAAMILSGGRQVQAKLSPDNKDESAAASGYRQLSETDTYLDLNTGKSFHVIYDVLNELYNRDDLFAFDLFVNTRTNDTMWQDAAIIVNHALMRDAEGHFKIDPSKVKRNGNGYKVLTGR